MRVFWTAAISALLITAAIGQKNYDNIPVVLAPDIVQEIQEYATKNPKVSTTALGEFANQKLKVNGYNFGVDPCDMKTKPTTMAFPGGYDNEKFHIYTVTDIRGKSIKFLAREPGDAPCGCYLDLPLKAITSKRAVVATKNAELVIKTPNNILFEQMELADATLRKTTRMWIVPDGGPPDGISADGTKLYVDVEDTPLFLEIGLDGVLKFVPRTAPDIIKKFVDLKKFPRDRNNDYLGFRRFTNGKRTFTIKFSHVCT